MATTNLFGHPAFKDGAFTSNDRRVRRAAIGKAMRSIDLGAELGAEVYVFWGGREGTEAGIAKDPRDALERYREAIDVLGDYVGDRATTCASRSSPSPTSRAGTSSCRRSATRCTSSRRSSGPTWSASTPRSRTRRWPACRFHHGVGQALWAGKLFHIDLNGAAHRPLRPGLPLRRRGPQGGVPARAPARARRLHRAAPLRRARLPQREPRGRVGLRGAAACAPTWRWPTPRAASTRCPRSRRRWPPPQSPSSPQPSRRRPGEADALKAEADALDALAERGYFNERLDQLVVEVLLGAR